MTREVNNPDENTIDAVSIGELMQPFGIGKIELCEINIESPEKELFEQNLAARLPHTRKIIIEPHEWMKTVYSRAFSNAPGRCKYTIRPRGFLPRVHPQSG